MSRQSELVGARSLVVLTKGRDRMRRIKALLVTAVCVLGLVGTVAVTPAQAAPWRPVDGVIFNNPKGSLAAERAIITHLDRAVNASPRGSIISMAMYLFDRPTTARALVAAHRRGVNVQLIVDDGEASPESKYVRRYLAERRTGYGSSFVRSCRRSCMSNVSGSVLHSKFYIFSRVGSTRNVSMISSANPHNVNTKASWNNIHTIANNATIYNSLRGYFLDMLDDPARRAAGLPDRNRLNYFDTRRPVSSGKYRLSFYPRAARSGVQTVEFLDALNRVSCSTGGGYGSRGKTVVRVAMWGFTNPLMAVAKKLRWLKSKGCKVDVIMNQGRASRSIIKELIRKTPKGQIPVYNAWRDKNRNDYGEMYVHHKAMIVNGRWNGRNTKVVWTGSQNLTSTGVRINDDQILRITDNKTYSAYSRNFSFIAGRYAPRMRTLPPPIILKSSPHSSRDRTRFGAAPVDPADGLSEAELKVLEDRQDAVTEAGTEG